MQNNVLDIEALMAKIKVHLLNFYGECSHIQIVLENISAEPHTYYGLNRWEKPENEWSKVGPRKHIKRANSTYSFDIVANPDDITYEWRKYWHETEDDADALGENCAVAAQWFLTKFTDIPKPNLSNVSWNHLFWGIVWPSFIPCPVTLPGRIMSNAKFHIESRTHPELANQYTRLFLYKSMALATLVFASSVFALTLAATILSGGMATLAITGCAAVGIASTYAFFKAHNILSAKNIADKLKKTDEQLPLLQNEFSPDREENLNVAGATI